MKLFQYRRKTSVILHDLIMSASAWQLAWLARFNFDINSNQWHDSLQLLPYVIIIQAVIFWFFNLYRGLWRFASLQDLTNITKSCLVGALVITIVLFMQFRLEGVPRSIPIFYPIFLLVLLSGPRLSYRLWKDHLALGINDNAVMTLIIGAGRAGEKASVAAIR